MWGATILPSLKHPQGASFNPRSHVGSDGIAVDEHQGERFQSTLPCGERRVNRWSCVRRNRFQSTLPCGERLISDEHKNSVSSVSIHAPMWGATNDPRFWAMTKNVSIHAPMWGATYYFDNRPFQPMFQSTLPCGERHHIGMKIKK